MHLHCLFLLVCLLFHRTRGRFFLRDLVSGGSVREGAGPSVRVPSILGVSTSAVFMKTWSVSMALEAASWRSDSVFASFYLCDVQYVFEGLHSLVPVVAAGSILQ